MSLDTSAITFLAFWSVTGIIWLSSLEFRIKELRKDCDRALNTDTQIALVLEDIKNRLIRLEVLLERRSSD